jgi:hypothetical protein
MKYSSSAVILLLIIKGENAMKTVWKWILGIVIVLVVVAVLVGGAILLRSHFNGVRIVQLERPILQAPGTGKAPFRNNGEGQPGWPGMMPFGGRGYHMRGPGMMGFGGRMPFAGIVGGLFCLGFLTLVILGVVWLVRSLRNPKPVEAAVVVPAAVAVHPCKKCGQPVQEGWNNCPNCGRKQ